MTERNEIPTVVRPILVPSPPAELEFEITVVEPVAREVSLPREMLNRMTGEEIRRALGALRPTGYGATNDLMTARLEQYEFTLKEDALDRAARAA